MEVNEYPCGISDLDRNADSLFLSSLLVQLMVIIFAKVNIVNIGGD